MLIQQPLYLAVSSPLESGGSVDKYLAHVVQLYNFLEAAGWK